MFVMWNVLWFRIPIDQQPFPLLPMKLNTLELDDPALAWVLLLKWLGFPQQPLMISYVLVSEFPPMQ